MVKNKDFRVIKNTIMILMPPVIIGSLIVGIFAEDFCAFLLGEEFRSAGKILRLLLPIVIMTPITYILGFPVMTPMGLSQYCNLSVIISACIHLFSLVLLFLTNKFSVVSLCYLTLFTEAIVLMMRVFVVCKNRMRTSGGLYIEQYSRKI
jgi:PST family polysaccharide transporter